MNWREQMILQAAERFEPDLVLVDKVPGGVQRELLPTLRSIKTWYPKTRLVLGMRDIEDDPATTIAEWEASGARPLHDEIYDSILLYGLREIFDPVREYGMSEKSAAKLIECGYLGRNIHTRSPEAVRRELDAANRPLIVVTTGGGGDGFELIKTFLDARSSASHLRDAACLVVTGPLMPRGKRDLLRTATRADNLMFIEFTPDLLSYLAAADLVVSMAGYNTVCEILSLGARSLLIPRVRPRQEQQLRAERLAERGLAGVILPDDLTAESLAKAIESAMNLPAPHTLLDLGGLPRVSRAIANLLADEKGARP
jgi:predicted glycosyltransferase